MATQKSSEEEQQQVSRWSAFSLTVRSTAFYRVFRFVRIAHARTDEVWPADRIVLRPRFTRYSA